MSTNRNESVSAPWGKTSRFTYKTASSKRHGAITREEKERFLTHGTLPKFKSVQRSEKALHKKYAAVETELLPEAITILNKVRDQYGNDGTFIDAAYGKKITINRASEVIHNYLVEHGIDGMMSVYFTSEMDCSGKMQWTGPMTKYNQPEKRNYSMWVKATNDNIYFRETGILNLTNHEIGTHFFRSINDGLQPWFANRLKFGLGTYKCQSMKDTEEGLASLNTAFESKVKYIWGPAMLYYIACMSMKMNFKELFDHLSYYVADPEIRWKWVIRVKRGRPPAQLGGDGKDQCYFRGAVNILRNADTINFMLLYSGKITVDDLPRVQRLARLGCIKVPYFLKDMAGYKKYMRHMLKFNGISHVKSIPSEPTLKVSLPKPARIKQTGFKNKAMNFNTPPKKTPRVLMLESRQRIMSTKILTKTRRRALDDNDEKSLGACGETLKIEHEADEDSRLTSKENYDNGDKQSFDDPADNESPTTAHEEDNQFEDSISTSRPQKIFLAGRRRSDTFFSPERRGHSGSNSPDVDYGKAGCVDVFCMSNHRKARKTPQQQKEEERVEIQEYFGNCASMDLRPSTAMSTSSRESLSQSRPNPNGALQLIREIPTTPTKQNPFQIPLTPPTPKPHLFQIISKPTVRKFAKSNTFSRLPNGQPSFPQPASRTPTPDLLKPSTPASIKSASTESIETTASKKSIRKNLTVFFSDLIPFSKSRRKRVLPLPVK